MNALSLFAGGGIGETYFDDIHVIPFSSQTFEGVEEVRRIIEETAEEARSYSADEEID